MKVLSPNIYEGQLKAYVKMENRNELEELIYDIRVVSGARFSTASRLEFSSYAKKFLINGVTAVSIFVSAGLLIANSEKFPVDMVAVILVGISIFLLWMNLDNSDYEIKARAGRMKACAIDLKKIIKKIQIGGMDSGEALTEYDNILNSYAENHHGFDRAYAIYKMINKHKSAKRNDGEKEATWLNSALPYFLISLWYPLIFVVWAVVVYVISRQIVQ